MLQLCQDSSSLPSISPASEAANHLAEIKKKGVLKSREVNQSQSSNKINDKIQSIGLQSDISKCRNIKPANCNNKASLSLNKYCLFKERTRPATTAISILNTLVVAAAIIATTAFVAFAFNFISFLATFTITAAVLLSLTVANDVSDHLNKYILISKTDSELEQNINICFANRNELLNKEEANKLNDDFFYKNLGRKSLRKFAKHAGDHNQKAFFLLRNKSNIEYSNMKNDPFIVDMLDIFSGMLIADTATYNMNLKQRLNVLKPDLINFLKNENNQVFIDKIIDECSTRIQILPEDSFIKDAMLYHLENNVKS